jgi:hypothetical protein
LILIEELTASRKRNARYESRTLNMAHGKSEKALIGRYGRLWTKVPANLRKLKSNELKDVTGIYVLYNGTMPVYVGQGKIARQVRVHNRHHRKSPLWEHFSWYEINGEGNEKEIETLFLKVLPHYLRALNKMGGKFKSARKVYATEEAPIKILWPKGGAGKKHHHKATH